MSYKNEEELKAGIAKWKSNRLRDKSPAGYKRHLAAVDAWNAAKNNNSGTSSGTTTNNNDDDDGKNWSPSDKEKETHNKNIADTKAAAKAAKEYKPERLPGIKQREYEVTLPKRPNVPKLPKLNVPGGGLKISEVKKPSGRSGTINKYSAKSDYSNAYPNALPKSAYPNALSKKKGKKK